jgi:hypothetical protein
VAQCKHISAVCRGNAHKPDICIPNAKALAIPYATLLGTIYTLHARSNYLRQAIGNSEGTIHHCIPNVNYTVIIRHLKPSIEVRNARVHVVHEPCIRPIYARMTPAYAAKPKIPK